MKKERILSLEARKKMGAMRGKKHSLETRAKMSEAQCRMQRTPEWRERMRIALLGKNKGKKLTPETKKKLSIAHKGRKASPETRRKMREVFRRGKLNNKWKGGITPVVRKIRTSLDSIQWRIDVFNRDNFICQMCGRKGGDLEAHHLKPFSMIIKENKIKTIEDALNCAELWDINNGQTLCIPCHNKTKESNPAFN